MTLKQQTVSNLEQKGVKAFKEGKNCAQSILSTFAPLFDFDENFVLDLASGFGAGMGRLQETCGAVTGAFMVIGLHNSKMHRDNSSLKEASMLMIQEFTQKFVEKNGTINCKSLIKCDLNTDEGQKYFADNKIADTICSKCISDSIRIINELTKK